MDERNEAAAVESESEVPACRTCDGEDGQHHRDCPDRDSCDPFGDLWIEREDAECAELVAESRRQFRDEEMAALVDVAVLERWAEEIDDVLTAVDGGER